MTEVEICNLALDNLGVTNKITDTADSSKEAKACSRWYATMRDVVLRVYAWPFAGRVALLTENPDPANLNPMWQYAYTLPGDHLKARRLVRKLERATLTPPPFEISLNGAGTDLVLVTNEPNAILEYTRKFDTDAKLALASPSFVDALSWKLAARLVLPLALDNAHVERAEKMYQTVLLEAIATDGTERQADPQPESELITARG